MIDSIINKSNIIIIMSKKKNSKTHNWVKSIISMSNDDKKVSFTFHFWGKRWHDVYVYIEPATMFSLAIKHGVKYARRIWIWFISCVWPKKCDISFFLFLLSVMYLWRELGFVCPLIRIACSTGTFLSMSFLTDACVRLWLSVLWFHVLVILRFWPCFSKYCSFCV